MRSSGSPNQHLPDNLRLDAGFVSALTGDYGLARDENGSWHIGETMDLSVLMRFTDPPTEVAVDIARNRLNPLLGTSYFDLPDEMSYSLVTDDPWGQYDDAVVNYATMLGRNDDAAAYYVASTGNDGQATLALVLDRPGHSDVDGGAALAALVQKGVTHDFLGSTVLNQAIDIIGRDGGIQEIKNPHMNDALAAGVAENMEVIERRALQDLGGDEFDARSPETLAAHDFLREVMGDEPAAGTIRAATAVHIQEMYAALPDDHDMRFDGLVDVGRVLGLTDTAHENAVIGAAEDRLAAANDAAGRINTEIGLIPGIGNAYSAYTLTVPSNLTLGSLVTHPDQAAVDAATQQAIDDAIRRNGNPLGVIVVTEHDARMIQAGGDDIEDAAKDRR